MYLRKLSDVGGAVSAQVAIASSRDTLLACEKTELQEFGGLVLLGKAWAHSVLIFIYMISTNSPRHCKLFKVLHGSPNCFQIVSSTVTWS